MAAVRESVMESPTVFVLGAGASNPFGFPLGSELKNAMLNHLRNPDFRRVLHTAGFGNDLIKNFAIALGYSFHPTIDIFLEKKTNFREIGAYVIARSLMPLEHQLQNLFPQKDWYGDLFTAMDFENEEPDSSLLSIVTLNYDRSLEHFLLKNIDYNCQHERTDFCHAKRHKIEVVHAHGSLGEYPDGLWPDSCRNSFLRYPCLKNFFHNWFITNDLHCIKVPLCSFMPPPTWRFDSTPSNHRCAAYGSDR